MLFSYLEHMFEKVFVGYFDPKMSHFSLSFKPKYFYRLILNHWLLVCPKNNQSCGRTPKHRKLGCVYFETVPKPLIIRRISLCPDYKYNCNTCVIKTHNYFLFNHNLACTAYIMLGTPEDTSLPFSDPP